MANNGRAAKPFQNADLDFLRAERHEPVKAIGETLQRFPWQSDDQISVNMNAGAAAPKTQIVGELVVILPTLDPLADFGVEALDAHLELQGAGRESGDEFTQRFRQPIWNHFEV